MVPCKVDEEVYHQQVATVKKLLESLDAASEKSSEKVLSLQEQIIVA